CSQYKKYFSMDGVELEFDDEALREIANLAIKQKAGARGLRAIMEKFMLKIMYDIPDMDKLRACKINVDVITKGSDPEYTLAGTTARRKAAGTN
ncbi:MAG: ATP-dependent Clp protease ATP-binding subunit ClpX, partial [Candidatus Cloacimonetes bacterium]|nr:ATP-dependent Clp protease ATP-binding subunit ClpX [Candidatus Cloacimonadota bacterium]